MDITQTFYDNLAAAYDQLFADWHATTRQQAGILHKLFQENGYNAAAQILDCACGIGTQAIGLAALGYAITASDFSEGALAQARERAAQEQAGIDFVQADFRALSQVFSRQFDVVICIDNALPHMLTHSDLETALQSILSHVKDGGMFVASIRDYDALLQQKPPYSPPYIHKTEDGQRVSFQTWDWEEDCYRLTQYIIGDEASLQVSKFTCQYRATTRQEITDLLLAQGCSSVTWLFPEETGFYQPMVVAKK